MEFAKLPQHVAFIMDGNGRWATAKGLMRLEGHRQGIKTVRTVVDEGIRLGIPYMTFYAFSTENWKRSSEEVSGLMRLLNSFFRDKIEDLMEREIKVRFIGNRMPGRVSGGELSPEILELMAEIEDKTANNSKITIAFAINYSGRDEILRAIGFLGEDILDGKTGAWDLTEDKFKKYLDTANMPDPDLMIRTSGEQRISNFLLWQLAYSEMVFHPSHWPNFGIKEFHACLSEFVSRDRRFGGVTTPTFNNDIVDDQ